MEGYHNGVQGMIRNPQSLALYFGCAPQCLNLVSELENLLTKSLKFRQSSFLSDLYFYSVPLGISKSLSLLEKLTNQCKLVMWCCWHFVIVDIQIQCNRNKEMFNKLFSRAESEQMQVKFLTTEGQATVPIRVFLDQHSQMYVIL